MEEQLDVAQRVNASRSPATKTYRPLSVIRAEIAGAQARLSVLLRERKGALASIRMKEKRHTPAFKASMKRGLKAFWSDPEKRAAQTELRRNNNVNHPLRLPKMSADQGKLYRKLRRVIPRGDALRAALSP